MKYTQSEKLEIIRKARLEPLPNGVG